MAEMPKTLQELKEWARRENVDPKKFAIDEEPDWDGYYLAGGPPWSIGCKTWPAPGFVVRSSSEAEICECFVEVVKGIQYQKGSLTRRLKDEITARIKASWLDETGEDPTEFKHRG